MSGLRKFSAPPEPLPVAFAVDGHRYVLADMPVGRWIKVLASEPPGCWWHAVPANLTGGGADHMVARLADEDDPFDLDDAERVAEGVLGAVLGVDLWVGHRIAQGVYGNWLMFDGWCASNGFDPASAPIGRVLSAVYAWRVSMLSDKKELVRFESDLWGPPPLRTASGRLRDQAPKGWNDDKESAAFMDALASSRGG